MYEVLTFAGVDHVKIRVIHTGEEILYPIDSVDADPIAK